MKYRKLNPINYAPLNAVHFVEAIDDLITILPPRVSRIFIPILFFLTMLIFGFIVGFLMHFILSWFTSSLFISFGFFFLFFISCFIYGIIAGFDIYKSLKQNQYKKQKIT